MSLTDRLIEMAARPPEPDPVAFTDRATCEVDDAWIEQAKPDEQVKAMRLWFLARYRDPQVECPPNPEGGYYFFCGGPYDPSYELQVRFDAVVSEEVIQALADEFLDSDAGDKWAPTELTAFEEWEDVFNDDPEGPLRRLRERLGELRGMAELDAPPMSRILLRQLVYAAVITALETYLWELAAYWLEHDSASIGRLVAGEVRFRNRLDNLGGDSDKNRAVLAAEVRQELRSKVWHRWPNTWPFLGALLSLELPSYASFVGPTKKRHDIAHRGGKDADHNPVNLSREDLDQLINDVSGFGESLQAGIDTRVLAAC